MLLPALLVHGALALAPITATATTSSNSSSAFFILFAHDIDSPAFPLTACAGFDCGRYDTFVLQPLNVTARHVAAVRAAGRPGATVLAYFDTLHVPIVSGCATGHSMGDHAGKTCADYGQCEDGPYLQRLRAAFPPSMADRNASASDTPVVCSYPGLADHVPHAASVAVLAPLLADVAVAAAFDGWYLDNRLSPALFAKQPQAAGFDRGVRIAGAPATSAVAAVELYTAWSPALSAALRRELDARRPPGRTRTAGGREQGGAAAWAGHNILVGNSAGALSDPALNGITLEMEACASRNCTDAALAQAAVGAQPPLGVFWLTHAESMDPAQQCAEVAAMQRRLPWMRGGTDFFDLSHIACNHTD